MKKIITILTVVFALSLQSCLEDKCNEDCFTPPDTFVFELVDSETGENLFTNGTLNSEDIVVFDVATGNVEAHTFFTEDNLNLLVLNTIGWETEIVELRITVDELDVFTIYVDTERVDDNCCAFTDYKEIRISNANYDQDSSSGIYKIYLD